MGDAPSPDTENTQTQTQNSNVEWSQNNTPSFIPNIWGRLHATKCNSSGKYCWNPENQYPEYYDLIQTEFSLGRSLTCTFVMKKDRIKEDIIKNVSKQHFVIRRDLMEILSPAKITDLSYNGTFVNNEKIGKGNSRVLDDNDVISVTHPVVQMFVFKDLLKNEQDKVPKDISKKYYISRTLGQGACGIVKLVYDKMKCTKHAMKIIKKSRLTNGKLTNLNDPEKIMNEINIMKALNHPCIISTEEVFESPDAVYIILEFMQGGELFDKITKQGHLSEKLARFLFRQIVLAVKYLHSQGITHRDLKPENVLLESKEDESLVKITDFGLSKFVGEDTFMKTLCGTPLYLAPEILKANERCSYGPEVDVWSLGVIFFVCLVGYLPFSADYKDISLKNQILYGKYRFSHEHWKRVSLQAKLLMKGMLTVQVARRLTLDQILNHNWMQDINTISRVESMLWQTAKTKQFHQLTVSSTCSDEENNNPNSSTVVKLTDKMKRCLSDSFSSCGPLAKKLKMEIIEDCVDSSDNTGSTNDMMNCCN